MPLMSIRAYARERGVNDKTIRKAIAAGKIPLVEGQIDSVVADASWARNRDGGQQSKLADAAPPPVHRHTAGAEVPLPLPAVAVEAPAFAGSSEPSKQPDAPPSAAAAPEPPRQPEFELAPLTAARIRNTDAATELKEIALRKLEGALLEAEEVERTWGELLQVIKDRLRLIPDDVAPALVACSDEAECRSILMREILTALGAISKSVAGLVAA